MGHTLEETVNFKFGGCGGNVMVGATKRSVRHQVQGGVSRVTVKSVPILMGKINASSPLAFEGARYALRTSA